MAKFNSNIVESTDLDRKIETDLISESISIATANILAQLPIDTTTETKVDNYLTTAQIVKSTKFKSEKEVEKTLKHFGIKRKKINDVWYYLKDNLTVIQWIASNREDIGTMRQIYRSYGLLNTFNLEICTLNDLDYQTVDKFMNFNGILLSDYADFCNKNNSANFMDFVRWSCKAHNGISDWYEEFNYTAKNGLITYRVEEEFGGELQGVVCTGELNFSRCEIHMTNSFWYIRDLDTDTKYRYRTD